MGRRDRLVVAIALAVLAVVLVRTAWVCDDAYITFRTVDNFLAGHGLVWNVGERVQAYSHPLWLLLLISGCSTGADPYHVALALSFASTLGAAALLAFAHARTGAGALLSVAAMFLSSALADYGTSGLENPLTHLLLAAFWVAYFRREVSARGVLVLALLAGLGMMTRLDVALLFLPGLAAVLWRARRLRLVAVALAGMLPLVAWEGFSLVYYGTPLPNTALAKLGAGMPAGELAVRGLQYLWNSLRTDPLTLTLVVAAATAAVARRRWRHLPLLAGVALYLAYVVKIGGDFMSGRFLTAPLLCAIASLARHPLDWRRPGVRVALVAALVLGLAPGHAPLRTGPRFGADGPLPIDAHGVADERRFYYPDTGLLREGEAGRPPTHRYGGYGDDARSYAPAVVMFGTVGFFGYHAGPEVHVIDHQALGDPLLSRLPALYHPHWRTGHFTRTVPAGTLETICTGRNAYADEGVRALYEHVALLTRAPLFAGARWRAIGRELVGGGGRLVDRDRFADPLSGAGSVPEELGIGPPGEPALRSYPVVYTCTAR